MVLKVLLSENSQKKSSLNNSENLPIEMASLALAILAYNKFSPYGNPVSSDPIYFECLPMPAGQTCS